MPDKPKMIPILCDFQMGEANENTMTEAQLQERKSLIHSILKEHGSVVFKRPNTIDQKYGAVVKVITKWQEDPLFGDLIASNPDGTGVTYINWKHAKYTVHPPEPC